MNFNCYLTHNGVQATNVADVQVINRTWNAYKQTMAYEEVGGTWELHDEDGTLLKVLN